MSGAGCVASHGPVVITLWSGDLDERDLAAVYAAQRRVLERYPEGFGCLFIADHGAGLASRDAQLASGLYCRAMAPHTRCFAHVSETCAPWLEAARSSLRVLRDARPAPYPSELFCTIEDAARWQARQLGMPPGAWRGIAAATERLRAGDAWRWS